MNITRLGTERRRMSIVLSIMIRLIFADKWLKMQMLTSGIKSRPCWKK